MKKSCIFVMLFIVSVYLTAQEQNSEKSGLNFSLSPLSLGLLSGYAEEIVYYDEGSDEKLSQLLWNMTPLVYTGVSLNLDWQIPEKKWGLFIEGSFKYGFSKALDSIMEDRDWAAFDNNGIWQPNFLTHYSVHDNRTDNAILAGADVGMSFKVSENILLKGIIAYDFKTFSWSARGGSFLYPAEDSDDDGNLDQQHFYLTDSEFEVGTYKQTWHIVSPGISLYGKFNQYFDIDISLKLSPLIWCSTIDEHVLRDLVIEETMDFGFFIEPKLVFSFKPNDLVALSLTVLYSNMSGTRGDAEYREAGKEDINYENIGGAGYSVFDIGLVMKLMLSNIVKR